MGVIVNLNEIKNGLTVLGVVAGGPAAKAGLKKGDRIVAIAGTPIRDRNAYFAVAKTLKAGDAVMLSVERGGMSLELKVQTGKK